MEETSGMIEVTGGRVWFRRLGREGTLPLLIVHGGPGAAAYYLEPLAQRMAASRPVVVYDQLGCGRSEMPDDVSLWTMDRACQELDEVREATGLTQCHLLGHSWGGWLSVEYLVRGPEGIEGVVLASTSASIPQFAAEAHKLVEKLPEPWRSILLDPGARANDDAGYQDACEAFYRRHLCRIHPYPDCIERSISQMADNQVYLTMNGPIDFDPTGPLRTWDRAADLHRITAPTLVTVGGYDEVPIACSQTLTDGIAGARLEVFEESGHMAHEEEPERYAAVVSAFLDNVD